MYYSSGGSSIWTKFDLSSLRSQRGHNIVIYLDTILKHKLDFPTPSDPRTTIETLGSSRLPIWSDFPILILFIFLFVNEKYTSLYKEEELISYLEPN